MTFCAIPFCFSCARPISVLPSRGAVQARRGPGRCPGTLSRDATLAGTGRQIGGRGGLAPGRRSPIAWRSRRFLKGGHDDREPISPWLLRRPLRLTCALAVPRPPAESAAGDLPSPCLLTPSAEQNPAPLCAGGPSPFRFALRRNHSVYAARDP